MNHAFTTEGLEVFLQKQQVLHAADIKIASGAFTVLLGPNGSGKSTLMRTLMGLVPIHKGKILCQGRQRHQFSEEEWARLVAWLPQNNSLPFDLKAYEVILLGRYPWHKGFPQKKDRQVVEETLETFAARELAERSYLELSGGERQRIALMRVFAQDAPILLLDEPTCNLDVKVSLMLLKELQGLARQKGKTVLASMHDPHLACEFSDCFMALRQGRMVAQGTTAELSSGEVLSQVFGVPFLQRQALTPYLP